MPRLKPFQAARESHQSKQRRHYDHRVHARPLPVAAAQVQPHPEFVEGQPHGHAVQQRDQFRLASHWPSEHAVTADRRQQENAIVQMVHMGSVQEKIKVRHLIGHDEKHADARDDEGDEKPEQSAPRQLVGRLTRDGMYRMLPIDLLQFRQVSAFCREISEAKGGERLTETP